MFRRTFTTWLTAGAIVAFAASPLLAQDKGARPNPGGSSGGGGRTASGSGGGGDAGSSAGTPSGSTSSGSSSREGGGSAAGPSGFNTDFAPARPERRAEPRNNSGQRPNAANRASSSSNGGGEEQRRAAAPGATASASSGDASGGRRAVPAYARPRDGRPVVGTAYERRPVGYPNNGYVYNPIYRYNNYYNRYPYGYYYAGYGLGLGYFYDPFMWGYYSPYGYGYPYYSGGFPYYGGGGGGYGGGYSRESSREIGGLRLKVKPLNGQVYVDGYYVGEVDSFDGNFQRLQIEAGAHKVEIRADGFETVQFDVMVNPGETVIYKGDMKRIQ